MSHTEKTILVFPFGPPASIEFAKACQSQGHTVIGASSLTLEPTKELASGWLRLPFFNAHDFTERLLAGLKELDIDEIYCCHPLVYEKINDICATETTRASLISNNGWQDDLTSFRSAEALVNLYHSKSSSCKLARAQITPIYYQTLKIPGWCSTEKIAAFIDVFDSVPKGDIIEIGVWCGKSATALAMLSRHFGQGNLLCIDPWANTNTFQEEDEGVNKAMLTFDMDEVWRHFICNMLALVPNHINYIRAASAAAHAKYAENLRIKTVEFGETQYAGRIALLHIDGNHDQKIVSQDLRNWCPHLTQNGWLVIDDYVHAWGQGPRIVADAFLSEHRDDILQSFVSGSALFIQMKNPVSPRLWT
ncbi:class I SAM-dependent methyltransferase [Kordiimonas sp.]|uniref:class I SAM-dependent methyltransferase n=1 Tax=Kordiimonas sp. TaxID=1970157 RepID=UPI003B522971